jgi:hypothetical protein
VWKGNVAYERTYIKILNTWKRKILRVVQGPLVEQGIWVIRNNQKLRGLQKDLDIVVDIKKKRLVWIEHLVRMDHESEIENIFESKPERRRRITRPKLLKRIF